MGIETVIWKVKARSGVSTACEPCAEDLPSRDRDRDACTFLMIAVSRAPNWALADLDIAPVGWHYCPHFASMETEVQRS